MIVKNEDGFVQKGKLFDAIWDGAEEKTIKTVRDVLQLLHDFPTADVVPVVRCENCTEWDEKEQECSHWYGFRENDFCSYGERREK